MMIECLKLSIIDSKNIALKMQVYCKKPLNMRTIFLTPCFCLFSLILFSTACLPKKNSIAPVEEDVPANTIIELDPSQFETPFLNVANTSDIVMYEINERAFSVSGNFSGILPRLDSIKALGVNVIWLMPIYPIGLTKSINSPYCIKDYKAVNPEFGNLEDLRDLVRAAHKRNISVILDWVANHTAWDHPWIENKAWYTQNTSGTIIHPPGTNWQDVADLNFDNAEMRLAMIKAMKYWVLTANIDGFRCDAADFVPFSFWKQAIDSLQSIKNRTLILLAEGARGDHFNAGFQMNFSWDFYSKNKAVFKSTATALDYEQSHTNEYNTVSFGSQKLRFTSNHDECAFDNTPIVLFGGKQASISAFVINSFMGGVPLIYNGQEVGCSIKLPFFNKVAINWNEDPNMLKTYKRLMYLRNSYPVLRYGALIHASTASICAFQRHNQSDTILVLANTRNTVNGYSIPLTLQNKQWKDLMTDSLVTINNNISLNPYAYRILQKQ